MEAKYKIIGMSCVNCATKIKNKVSVLPGIKNVAVNYGSEFIRLEFDPDYVTLKEIKKVVSDAGYKMVDTKDKEKFSNFQVLIVMQIFMGFSIILKIAHMFGIGFFHSNPKFYAIIVTIISLAIIILGFEFFSRGTKRLMSLKPDQDSLVALGVGAAALVTAYSVFQILVFSNYEYINKIYFEEIAIIIPLMYLGRYIEKRSNRVANDSVRKIINLTANKATRIAKDGNFEEIEIHMINKGDILIIKAGEQVPFDGKIIKGEAEIDESLITGENLPVFKKIDEKVIGGSTLKNGYIQILIEKEQGETFLSKIANLIDTVESSKSPIEKLVDKIAGIFVFSVNIIAISTFVFWYFGFNDLKMGLESSILILIVACPCALGIATPLSMMMAVGRASTMGILIKKSEILQTLPKASYFLLDKTGTLTKGSPKFMSLRTLDNSYSDTDVIKITASIESTSRHPIAVAIVEEADKRKININNLNVDNIDIVLGKGMSANCEGKEVNIGNKRYMEELGIEVNFELIKEEIYFTQVYIAVSKKFIGIINVFDEVKENAKEFVEFLHRKKYHVGIISGDNEATTRYISEKLGIENYFANVLPENKEEIVKKFQDEGNKVVMIGDGINDAPALTRADIGISFGSATDIAIESTEVVLVNNDLSSIEKLVSLSEKTLANIKQNLFWAFVYNVVAVPIAGGYLSSLGITINPFIAAFMMIFSSLFVVFNSLRLKNIKL